MWTSPSAAVNHPLSMWTSDLGWLGGSGLPTLDRKPKKSVNKTSYGKHEILYTTTSGFILRFPPIISYFQRSGPPWERRVCCLVSRPRHRACRPVPRWPQCAVGSDVCRRSAEGLYPLTWKENNASQPLIKLPNYRSVFFFGDNCGDRTGTESGTVRCSVVWSPTAWVGQWSSPSKSLSSSGMSQRGWCCCLHSLSAIKQ